MRTFGATLLYGAPELQWSGTATYTRNAKGNLSVNQAVSQTVYYHMSVADFRRVYATAPNSGGLIGTFLPSNEFQEAFGSTPATAGATGPGNPVSGGGASAQFEVAQWPFGLQVVDIFAWYSVQGAS